MRRKVSRFYHVSRLLIYNSEEMTFYVPYLHWQEFMRVRDLH